MQVVNGFWDMLHQYMGWNILYLFAALAWILFLYQLKKQARRVALLAALLLFAVVFNPLSYRILITVTGQVKTYYRFLWIIPWETAIAYLLYEGMQRMDNLRHRLLLVCGICLGLLCMNTSQEQWRLPENSYQLSYDILEVAEHLKSLRTEAGRDRITILADTNICHAIREYDASICFPFESYHISGPEGVKGNVPAVMTMLMNNQDYYDTPMITETLNSNQVDYLVISINNDVSLSYMQRLHWQIVATTSSYHILQYQEPVFTTEPLSAAGLEIEEVEVVIPGLTEEYHFLFLADLHIITANEEIHLDDQETVLARQSWFSVSEGVTAAQYWGSLPDILDSCNADGILLGGDMMDFCSPSNIACLKQGLDRLVTPWLYVRADHDVKPYWCQGLTQEQCDSFHSEIDGNSEVWYMELPELCVAGLSNSTEQITESGLQQMKELCSAEKPVILLTHVPYESLVDNSLLEASKEAWQNRALVWGAGCTYQPDRNTREFLDMIYAADSPVKGILCGHLHFSWDGAVTETTRQHVFSPAFEKKIGVITVSPGQ